MSNSFGDFPRPPGQDQNFYILLVEFTKSLQQQTSNITSMMSEFRLMLTTMSERMARMEAQDLLSRINQNEKEFKEFSGEISKKFTSLEEKFETKIETKFNQIAVKVDSLEREGITNASKQKVYNTLVVFAAGMIGPLLTLAINWNKIFGGP